MKTLKSFILCGCIAPFCLGLVVLCAMDVPATEPLASAKWTTVAQATLDEEDDSTLYLFNPDPGIKTKIAGGVATIAGTSEVAGYVDTGMWRPIGGDDRTMVEVAVDFKVANIQSGQAVLCLPSSAGTWCLVFSGGYIAHPVHFTVPFTVKHYKDPGFTFGNEDKAFHSLRMVFNRATMELSYFADDVLLSVVQFKKPVEPLTLVQAGIETSGKDARVEVSLDNLRVRVAGPRFPVK